MLATLLFVAAIWSIPGDAPAAELVMFDSASCPHCLAWHREIGPIYPRTDEARAAPLRRVQNGGPWPADLPQLASLRFTPTFVVVHCGAEVARIEGYQGENLFWWQLSAAMERLKSAREKVRC